MIPDRRKALNTAAAGITYAYVGGMLAGEGLTMRGLLRECCMQCGADYTVKEEKAIVYRRVRSLVIAGTETGDFAKIERGGKLWLIRPTEADRAQIVAKAKAAAEAKTTAANDLRRIGIEATDATIGSDGVLLPFATLREFVERVTAD